MRYRTVTRTREVPHTVAGVTRLVDEPYTVQVPVPPRDWDHIVATGTTAAAVALLGVSVVWSTASVGDLLSRAVAAPFFAYLAAVAFDLPWIGCLALQWLARFDPERARAAERYGRAGLVLAMAAIFAHGWLESSVYVGAAGAAVSLLAKVFYGQVLAQQARPLPARTQAWLQQADAEIHAQLALGARMRHLDRIGQRAALLAPQPAQDAPQDTEDTLHPRPVRAAGTQRAAVRAVLSTLPGATVDDVLDQLDVLGIDADEDTVRALMDTPQDRRDTEDSRSERILRPIAPPGQSISDTVRTAVSTGMTDLDKIVSYVQSVHGPDVSRDTIRRTVNRVLPARRTS
ncbi:hypothetical protein [Streptomyces sp. NPDC095602]|uniref:hypothetical protein n=1 Tax=Streptomyces sp. NPDC095602 TaxID=3155819 RepID=UPI00332DC990